jgi:hypothetical protein
MSDLFDNVLDNAGYRLARSLLQLQLMNRYPITLFISAHPYLIESP